MSKAVLMTLKMRAKFWYIKHGEVYADHWTASPCQMKLLRDSSVFLTSQEAHEANSWLATHYAGLVRGLVNS